MRRLSSGISDLITSVKSLTMDSPYPENVKCQSSNEVQISNDQRSFLQSKLGITKVLKFRPLPLI
jgi:hypothetical protein